MYEPPPEILARYASVLVDFALGGGGGVKRDEVVRIAAPESARPLYAELHRAVWRAGAHALGAYQTDDDERVHLAARLPRAGGRGAARLFPRALHARARGRDGPPGVGDRRQRPALARLRGPGEDHASRRGDAAAARLAHREGERGALHVDPRPVRNARDGGRGGHGPRGVLAADRPRLLSRPRGPRRELARGGRAASRTPVRASTRCRSSACTWRAPTSTCA